jgi:hypothetical protein
MTAAGAALGWSLVDCAFQHEKPCSNAQSTAAHRAVG